MDRESARLEFRRSFRIIRFGCDDIDTTRYIWGKITLPNGYKWKDAITFRDNEYDFPRIDFLIVAPDLAIKFCPSRFFKHIFPSQKPIFLTIRNFKQITADKVINDLCGYDSVERMFTSYFFPLGRHFDDGILTIWDNLKGDVFHAQN